MKCKIGQIYEIMKQKGQIVDISCIGFDSLF